MLEKFKQWPVTSVQVALKQQMQTNHTSDLSRYAARILNSLISGESTDLLKTVLSKVPLTSIPEETLNAVTQAHEDYTPAWYGLAMLAFEGQQKEMIMLSSNVEDAVDSVEIPAKYIVLLRPFEFIVADILRINYHVKKARAGQKHSYQSLTPLQNAVAYVKQISGYATMLGKFAAQLLLSAERTSIQKVLSVSGLASGKSLIDVAAEMCIKEANELGVSLDALMKTGDIISIVDAAERIEPAVEQKLLTIVNSKATQKFKTQFKAFKPNDQFPATILQALKNIGGEFAEAEDLKKAAKAYEDGLAGTKYGDAVIQYGHLAIVQSRFRILKPLEQRNALLLQAGNCIKNLQVTLSPPFQKLLEAD